MRPAPVVRLRQVSWPRRRRFPANDISRRSRDQTCLGELGCTRQRKEAKSTKMKTSALFAPLRCRFVSAFSIRNQSRTAYNGCLPARNGEFTAMTPSLHRRDFLHASLGLSLVGAATGSARAAEPTETRDRSWEKNQVIQEARQAALEILKPSEKDLKQYLLG